MFYENVFNIYKKKFISEVECIYQILFYQLQFDFLKEMWTFVKLFQSHKRASWSLNPLAQNLVFKNSTCPGELLVLSPDPFPGYIDCLGLERSSWVTRYPRLKLLSACRSVGSEPVLGSNELRLPPTIVAWWTHYRSVNSVI